MLEVGNYLVLVLQRWKLMSSVLFQSPDAADDLRCVDDRNNSGKLMAKGVISVLLASHHGCRGFPFASLWNQPWGLQLLAAWSNVLFLSILEWNLQTRHVLFWVGYLHCALGMVNDEWCVTSMPGFLLGLCSGVKRVEHRWEVLASVTCWKWVTFIGQGLPLLLEQRILQPAAGSCR